ncbi:MAG: hypothetical protein M3376_06350 [Actinomycetota bacterium]|nr:hypothetical protein [Actinomycetota bacterium]
MKKPLRRPKGTGSLLIRRDVYGRDIWYGKWRVGDEQVKRRSGPKRDLETGEPAPRPRRSCEG